MFRVADGEWVVVLEWFSNVLGQFRVDMVVVGGLEWFRMFGGGLYLVLPAAALVVKSLLQTNGK